jgi:hypothetical protein
MPGGWLKYGASNMGVLTFLLTFPYNPPLITMAVLPMVWDFQI